MARALSNPVILASPEKGVDGRTTLAGARAPTLTDGRIGDFWVDTTVDEQRLYGPKTAAGWPDRGLIKGNKGWTPVFAAVVDGARRVQRVVDWQGGEGPKPATGKYVGPTGFVDAIASAVDIRGAVGPQGSTDFDELTSLPTTLEGYGIQDAATLDQGEKADSAIQLPTFKTGIRYWLGYVNLYDYMTDEQIVAFRSRVFAPGGRDSLQAALNALPSKGGVLYVPDEGGKLWMDASTVSEFSARGIGPYHVRIQDKHDWTFDGGNMEITATDAHTLPQTFFIFRCHGHTIKNVIGIGNNTGLTSTQNNGMLFQYCVSEFLIKNVKAKGYQGSLIVGNFQFDGIYEDCKVTAGSVLASAFDVASWQNVKLIRPILKGIGGGQGFQIHYDAPNSPNLHPSYNETGKVLRENRSNNIRIEEPDISGFRSGVVLGDIAGDLWINGGRIYENTGSDGDYWFGISVLTSSAGVADGGGPVQNINLNDVDIYSNGRTGGTVGTSGGIGINAQYASVEVILNKGTRIHDNKPNGVVRLGGAPTLRADGADFRPRFSSFQTTNVYQDGNFNMPASGVLPDNASRIINCPGYNPRGFKTLINTPAVPVGTGSGNKRRNINPYPVMVQAVSGLGVRIEDPDGNTSGDLGSGATLILQPGDSIWFGTTVPAYWSWYGL